MMQRDTQDSMVFTQVLYLQQLEEPLSNQKLQSMLS